jgi:hypothetical protein
MPGCNLANFNLNYASGSIGKDFASNIFASVLQNIIVVVGINE